MTHDVFISYAGEDKQVAEQVCRALEGEGVRCWIAPRDIPPGRDYEESIVEAIAASRALVLILSTHSNSSAHVRREIQHAYAEGSSTQVIPFRIEHIPYSRSLSYYLGSVQWINASAPPLEQHLPQLVQALRPAPPSAASPGGGRDPRPASESGPHPFVADDPRPALSASESKPRSALWFAGGAAVLLVVAFAAFLAYRAAGSGGGNRNALNANIPATPVANANARPPTPVPTPTPTSHPAPSPAGTRPPIRNMNLRIPANIRQFNANVRRREP